MQCSERDGYDKAVMGKVKEKGLEQCKVGDHELSQLQFNLDSVKTLKGSKKKESVRPWV